MPRIPASRLSGVGIPSSADGNDTILGSRFDDSLIGGNGRDYLVGGDGNDYLEGGAERDVLYGGRGADTFSIGEMTDSLTDDPDYIGDFETGIDKLGLNTGIYSISLIRSGSATFVFGATGATPFMVGVEGDVNGSDLLDVRQEGIYMLGDAGDNRLVGTIYNDAIDGGAGNDTIIGGVGADRVYLGPGGADVVVYREESESSTFPPGSPYPTGVDTIYDFETGTDKIDLSAIRTTAVSLVREGNSTFVYATTLNYNMKIGVAGRDVNAGDIVYNGTHGVSMVGDAGDNVLVGSKYGEPIQGGAGNDTITGGLGADEVWGGAGADTFKYLAAADSTPNGYDVIRDFQTGVDQIDLTSVNQTALSLVRSGSSTFLFADTPNGSMTIGVDGDVNIGDVAYAGTNSVYLLGDAGTNTLIGGANADKISGGAGNDTITGGLGADSLWGARERTSSNTRRRRIRP